AVGGDRVVDSGGGLRAHRPGRAAALRSDRALHFHRAPRDRCFGHGSVVGGLHQHHAPALHLDLAHHETVLGHHAAVHLELFEHHHVAAAVEHHHVAALEHHHVTALHLEGAHHVTVAVDGIHRVHVLDLDAYGPRVHEVIPSLSAAQRDRVVAASSLA